MIKTQVKTEVPNEIEALLDWVYRAHKAHIALDDGRGLRGRGYARDSVQVMAEVGELGFRVAGHSGGHAVPEVCEDVDAAVGQLGKLTGSLVRDHAVSGVPPGWMPGAVPCMGPVWNTKGKPTMMQDGHGHSIGCYVEIKVAAENIEARREIYCLWWDGLDSLATSLRNDYGLMVSGPACPREPWAMGGAGDVLGADADRFAGQGAGFSSGLAGHDNEAINAVL